MNYYSYTFDKLPGFSKLFCDFINHEPFFDERFPSNKKLFEDTSYLENISEKFNNRKNQGKWILQVFAVYFNRSSYCLLFSS